MTLPGLRPGGRRPGPDEAGDEPGSTLLWADLIADGLLASVSGGLAGETVATRPRSPAADPPRAHPPPPPPAAPELHPAPPTRVRVPPAAADPTPAAGPADAPQPPAPAPAPADAILTWVQPEQERDGFAAPAVPAGPAPVPAAAPLEVRPGAESGDSSGGAHRSAVTRGDVVTGRAVGGLNRADRESPSAELALRLALRSTDTELSLAVGTLLAERSRDRERLRRLDSALRAVLAMGELSPGAVALLRALTVSGP